MLEDAIRILDSNRIMAISTVRPDGWPQNTIVGYANDGLQLYFMIFRASQKFANIERDERVAVAVGSEPTDARDIKAVYCGAHACEVTDPSEWDRAWKLLSQRHPNLRHFAPPAEAEAAMMRAACKYISILDFSKGFGHAEAVTVEHGTTAPADKEPEVRTAS